MKAFCYVMLCALLCSACRSSEKESKISDVRNWIGREIKFPANGLFTYFGKDTISQLPSSTYTIVNYIDSVGCVGCRLRTLEWKSFMNKLERLYPRTVSLLFYIQVKDTREELMWILRGDDFTYPICIDKDGLFGKINRLPLGGAIETFLLNANNVVQLVGSPIANPSLEKLYIEELEHHKQN